MIRMLFAAAAAAVLSASAFAQDADFTERERLALETVELTGATDLVFATLDTMAPTMRAQFAQASPNSTDAQLDAAMAIVMEGFRERRGMMETELAAVYARNLSAEDLRAVNAFYRTEAGQRMVAVTPTIMTESSAVGERIALDIFEQRGAEIFGAMGLETEE
ncbi:MAG: DUF2059 domain-containing protein [Oceanicaulis sp.]